MNFTVFSADENKPDEIRRDRFGAVARDVFRARGRFYGRKLVYTFPIREDIHRRRSNG